MATLQELKEREIGLLNSHNSRFIEYGRALKDIIIMCNNFAGKKLSENMLISEMAEEYVEKEKINYDLTGQDYYRDHIKIAAEYFQRNSLSFEELYKILSTEDRILSFEEAKVILIENPEIYKRIKSQTLIDVLKFIELNKRE